MAEMAHWTAEYHTSVQSFLSDLDEQTLRKMIKLPWAGRLESLLGKKPEDLTQSETMIQVCLHSSYHRGQVNSLIRRSNSTPSLTDFIVWVWLGKPAAVWEDLFE